MFHLINTHFAGSCT